MENFFDKGAAVKLQAIIADENTTPEKRKWAEGLLHDFHQLMEDQGKMMSYMTVIAECDLDDRKPLMQARDDLFYHIAFQYYYLLKTVDPENESNYRNEFETAVKEYDRDYGLKSR